MMLPILISLGIGAVLVALLLWPHRAPENPYRDMERHTTTPRKAA